MSGGRSRSSSRKRSSSRGRGLSGGARGDATSQFNKAVRALVRLGRGAFDSIAAEEALLRNESNNLPARLQGIKFMEIRDMVPGYFWESAKARKMLQDIEYEDKREEEQIKRGETLGKILDSLSYEKLGELAKDSKRVGERLAIAEMLKGSGVSGGRRRRKPSKRPSAKKLTEWQRVVKKHAGDMVSAKKEYYGRGLEEGGRLRRRSSSKKKKRSSSRRRGSALGRTY